MRERRGPLTFGSHNARSAGRPLWANGPEGESLEGLTDRPLQPLFAGGSARRSIIGILWTCSTQYSLPKPIKQYLLLP